MPTNTAAWLLEPKAHPFVIKEAPLWKPLANEILLKNRAVAINPVDPSLQKHPWWPLTYPTMLGQDIAGEVAAVGPGVTRFKVGDRVVGHADGMTSGRNENNAFQAYTVIATNLASHIPEHISYEGAVVLPLGLSTAACGLFQEDFLNLRYPTEPHTPGTGETLLVWGGASSVGSNAIQLAVAAGYEVITTASPKNFAYAQRLGAAAVFDYNSATIVDEIVAALEGKTFAGAIDCIGPPATQLTVDVVARVRGAVKFVSTVKPGYKGAPEGVAVKMVLGTTLKENEVGKAVYEDFLPRALEARTFVPAPEPLVAGRGLESIQAAVDLCGKGVSASKIVVSL
ncbi:zinc-binding oxidoreductase CipB [Aspergillus pseudoustus]|uniref:Zinc-binding oxidoreductase CipB n=1 Tax=Aspergillus pseudoustus TaxID=1810923 RepID=A0ABR4ID59_9EURO